MTAETKTDFTKTGIYLDNNATTKTDPLVYEAMIPFFTEYYGNPSSMHRFGEPVRKAMEHARHQVAEYIGAAYDDEIIFTACATESDNTALCSAIEACAPARNEIITTAVEHPAILDTCAALAKKGVKVHYLGVDSCGRLNLDEYKALLSEKTAIVSIMWANNETGTVFPVEIMAKMAKEVGAQFHTDAVQAMGKIKVDVRILISTCSVSQGIRFMLRRVLGFFMSVVVLDSVRSCMVGTRKEVVALVLKTLHIS